MFRFRYARPLFDIADDSNFGNDMDDILGNDNPVDDVGDTDPQDNDDDLSGEEELLKALRDLANPDDPEDGEDEDDKEDDTKPEDVVDDVVDDDQEGKKQSAEDNAKFAAQRRQAELDKKVQAELDRLKAESPEFLLAKQLQELYGTDSSTLLTQIKEAQLQKESQAKGVPLEVLKEREIDRQRTATLEKELNQLKYESWKSRIDTEGLKLQDKYKMLTPEDIEQSVSYMLNTVHNVDMPLEQAVYAVHGAKIVEEMTKTKIQDQLAEQSGRKRKTPIAPQGGKGEQAVSLSPEEQYIAKLYGMSAEEYNKYKS